MVARVLVRKAMAGDVRAAALVLGSEPRRTTIDSRLAVSLAETMAADGSISAATRVLLEVVARQVVDVDHAPPSVCPADTGRPEDIVNHFIATGQLPADPEDMPEFCFETLAAFLSGYNSDDVMSKLATRTNETFGSVDGFAEACRRHIPGRKDKVKALVRRIPKLD